MTENNQNDRPFRFEAVGFVATRTLLEALEEKGSPSEAEMFDLARALLAPLGFTGVDEVYVTEDDAQPSRDIKVFVVISLRGPAELATHLPEEDLPAKLVQALGQLSEHVCFDASGKDCVGAESWEFVNAADFE